MRSSGRILPPILFCSLTLVAVAMVISCAQPTPPPIGRAAPPTQASSVPEIVVSSTVPTELNSPFDADSMTGGAPNATPEQAAAFAWNEFIALNWPAGPQAGQPGQRDAPSGTCLFGDPDCGPTVWQTYRSKVETFPGDSNPPPGYVNDSAKSYGYDALPKYNYAVPVEACDKSQKDDPAPWINLDETDEITLANMHAGVVEPDRSPGNSAPQLIRYVAKSNRTQYVYVAGNSDPNIPSAQWWSSIPEPVVRATKNFLAAHQTSPPPGSRDMVSLPNGTIEVKAAWRPVNQSEIDSGDFHTQKVRFYELTDPHDETSLCYRDAIWGLVALHIIQKTPSAPYFIYATFEQSANLLTAGGDPVEDVDGNVQHPEPATATAPQVCLNDPQPSSGRVGGETPSTLGKVVLTNDPTTCKEVARQAYCDDPKKRLYYRNAPQGPVPSSGNICVNKRDLDIPDYVVAANRQAHTAIERYLQKHGSSAPWLNGYKLVNVQYFPYDKVISTETPNGALYTSHPPYTARNPAPSSFYLANIVVETNRSLQLFSGGLSPYVATDWNMDGTAHKNTYYGGKFYNMGGCMGCHGSQGQNPKGQAGDFSVILARGSVILPEVPSVEASKSSKLTTVRRNRSLKP